MKIYRWIPDATAPAGGVACLDDIRARCDVDPESGCWHWTGAISYGRRRSFVPAVHISTGVIRGQVGCTVSVARAAWLMQNPNRYLTSEQVVWRTCGERACCNPDHLKAGTRLQQAQWLRSAGLLALSQAQRRAFSVKLAQQTIPAAEVAEIEALLAQGLSNAEVQRRTGRGQQAIRAIRRGEHPQQVKASNSSVFAWAARAAA